MITLFLSVMMAAAVVPALLLLKKIYDADRLEKEPMKLLVFLLFIGVLSTVLASFTEGIGMTLLANIFPDGGFLNDLILYFIVVGLSEEGFKYIVLKRATWKNPEFNCQFDGVVYAVFVSLGFAIWENIQYVFSYGLGTALVRAVTAVPGHACFGVFMGAFYGMAKRAFNYEHEQESRTYCLYAVIVPAVIHGIYDFTASTSSVIGFIVFVVFVIFMFIRANKLVNRLAAEDEYIDDGVEFTYK